MGVALFHGDFAWIIGGFVAFLGIMVFLIKIARGHIFSFIVGALVWWFVYSLHSGSNSGIMTATLAALLFDLVGIPILKLAFRFGR
jgi:hypothetical protein